MMYVNVVIDYGSIYTDRLFTYLWEGEPLTVGNKVIVPFGKGDTLREGYIMEILDSSPTEVEEIKSVVSVDKTLSLTKEMVETSRWMKQRYLCKYIDGIRLFLPAGKPLKRGKRKDPYDLWVPDPSRKKIQINKEQERVIEQITKAGEREGKEIFLLHGVTGSGKTEVYLQVVAHAISRKKTAIVLVPEIALTGQLVQRFMERLGKENIAVLHSKLSPGQRYDQWQKIRKKEVTTVIGARSAVFAPLENIGVIILDEEHESTYKSDQSPKYETLELAIKRSKFYGGNLVLGSATPSVVSYYRSEMGIYRRLDLKERYNKVPLPHVEIVDMKRELKKGNNQPVSQELFSHMKRALAKEEQVILLLNRRGYFPYVLCKNCGHVFHCPHCDISLTYHKGIQRLSCHYCGYTEPPSHHCPRCKETLIAYEGMGTERLEEWIQEYLPEYNVARLDLDTTKEKGAADKILDRFQKNQIQILLGTQIVAKGLDFKNVSLVGVINGDTGLYFPDFRSTERTFQLIMQAAGRSGRGKEKGNVVVQTCSPEHYAVLAGSHQDYNEFYNQEIQLRKWGSYPPFSDIIQLVFSGKRENILVETTKRWETILKKQIGDDQGIVRSNPIKALGKSQEMKAAILIKSLRGQRSIYMQMVKKIREEEKESRGKYRMVVDINPYSLWRN